MDTFILLFARSRWYWWQASPRLCWDSSWWSGALISYFNRPLLIQQPCLQSLQAPAASLTSFAQEAQADLGECGPEVDRKNASKAAHPFIGRWNLAWKVPMSKLVHKDVHGHEIVINYIKPSSFVRFLVDKCPELLLGGVMTLDAGCSQLEAFWKNYEYFHPSHRLFTDRNDIRSTRNTFPVCFHGDEGRGKKKGNTCVTMFEPCLGVATASNMKQKRRHDQCDECCLRDPCAKRFRTAAGTMKKVVGDPPLCAYQAHNTKNNSYLTKFVLSVLPNDAYKETNLLNMVIEEICKDFKDLFEHGILVNSRQWFVGMTGCKGDLKWYEKIANLHRCFNKQCGSNLQMCHECEAGNQHMPWEDSSHFPCWGGALYKTRPWVFEPAITTIPFEPEDGSGEPEKVLRRDLFHNTKVGILRDFTGSTILFLIFLGYFQDQGPGISNARDVCLQRAFQHFYLFCLTTRGKPGCRSFTPVFFNAKTQSDFGWINAKGSDVTLIVKWIGVLCYGLMQDPLSQHHLPILRRIHSAAICVNTWQHALYNHGLWLPRHCGMCVYQEIHEFLQHYNALAYDCLTIHHFTAYSLKSKFHMLAHTKHELGLLIDLPINVQWVPNALVFGGDERRRNRKNFTTKSACGQPLDK